MTLRARLAVALAAVVTVLLVAGLLVPRAVRAAQIDQVDDQLVAVSGAAMGFTNDGVGFGPMPGGAVAPGALSEVYVARVLSDGSREVLATPQSSGSGEPADVPPVSTSPDRLTIETVGSTGGDSSWRAVTLPPAPGGGSPVIVAIPLDRVDQTTHQLQLVLLAAGLAVGVVLALAGWWVVRLGIRPINEVTDVADAIAHGDRDRRVTVDAQPATEAAHLARAFNVMLDERAAAEDRLRRFVGDASHELRTPVTAIKGFTDLYRQGALDDQGLADAMRRIGQEASRMGTLVDDLLLLARLDQGRPLESAPVDVSAILGDAALDAGATHPSRTVRADVPPGLTVDGDDARLRQVVANLVANALAHTDGDVSINARSTDGNCVVEVADDGPGMDADAAAHLFDRFWRGDPSRARHRAGAGLGMSIVKAIVDAHGGMVGVETAPAAGTTITVVLPEHAQQTHSSP